MKTEAEPASASTLQKLVAALEQQWQKVLEMLRTHKLQPSAPVPLKSPSSIVVQFPTGHHVTRNAFATIYSQIASVAAAALSSLYIEVEPPSNRPHSTCTTHCKSHMRIILDDSLLLFYHDPVAFLLLFIGLIYYGSRSASAEYRNHRAL